MKARSCIKRILTYILLAATVCSLLGGCEFLSQYIDPETGEQSSPAAPISLLKRSSIKTLVSTDMNVFFLMNDVEGSVLVTGCNRFGLLGQGTTDNNPHSLAVRVPLPERIKLVDANTHLAAAVSDSNKIYIWGDLSPWGITIDKDHIYKEFSFTETITDISVGAEHIAVLTKNGKVYTLGVNNGQLGYDLNKNRGEFYPDFKAVDSDVEFSLIETSLTATYMVTTTGELYGASANEHYELGYLDEHSAVSRMDNVKPIELLATAGRNVFALANDGSVYVCGENSNGVLGINNDLPYAEALTKLPFTKKVVSISGDDETTTVHFLTKENELYACGVNDYLNTKSNEAYISTPTLVQIENVTRVFAEGSTRFIIDSNRRLYSYGSNLYGQMPGVGNEGKKFSSPVRLYISIK
ncbi:MAG: hypothetical protein J6L92_01945 [Clostridia bacterium]|nr:hypothetical protein [Clostridia bacterium]